MTLAPHDCSRLKWGAVVFALAFALKAIGDVYPFSHFPMYSNFGGGADVLRVETPDGTMIPMEIVFRKKESRCKKMWKTKLGEICGARGHDSDNANAEEKRLAGEYLLEKLVTERRAGKLEEYATPELVLVHTRIELSEDGVLTETEEPIAHLSLQP